MVVSPLEELGSVEVTEVGLITPPLPPPRLSIAANTAAAAASSTSCWDRKNNQPFAA